MKLIIGLGNPGKQYENTRHNTGFMIVDRLREIAHFSDFKLEEKFNSLVAEKKDSSGETVYLLKPQTFMNSSGQAVKAMANFYKIPLENISVIHDDLDITLGEYKISADNSAAGHNGVQSIMDELGTQKIIRYRVGIEGEEKRKERTIPGDAFVLQKFTDEELGVLEKTGIVGGIAFDLKL
jgi:peptidyl-tRNA hydrolase, PTH1 family